MRIEAVLLTGGASRRMGEDKAGILIDGLPQAQRIADALGAVRLTVTVLGREPIPGHAFLRDSNEFAGPLSALAQFEPSADAVFVCSCDLPLFDARIASTLADRLGARHASVPQVNGFRQPLCALYRAQAFAQIPKVLAQEGACAMRWLDALDHVIVHEEELSDARVDPQCAQGANTREEFERMLAGAANPSTQERAPTDLRQES